MKSILIVSSGYPTDEDPDYAFIQPIARCFADSGLKCTVLAPQSITKIILHQKKRRGYKWFDKTKKGNSVTIFQPYYFSASNLCIGRSQISSLLKMHAVKKCYRKERIDAEVFYAHFWDCGVIASTISKKKSSPLFVASGESRVNVCECFSNRIVKKALPFISGIICVSSKNLIESEKLGLLLDNSKAVVIPNGYNPTEFYIEDKTIARKHLGIALNEFIVIYVGEFCERKGPDRVIEATKNISNARLIMIGWGDKIAESEQIIFKGSVPHDQLVHYLNAADVFVLPTLAEGCCNAIVEAMACGLPIISSNLTFNDDILDETNSIRVDPMNVEEIADAIRLLSIDQELRQKLSQGSRKIAVNLTIQKRTERILSFIEGLLHG